MSPRGNGATASSTAVEAEAREPERLPHVVIIGAGFGGLAAARALGHKPVRVTWIDRRNHHLFQPLLYQVATAALSPADIAAPIRAIMRRYSNIDVIMDEVIDIDPEQRLVKMHRQAVSYDYLVVATGAETSYFGHDEWRRFANGLKSLEEATAIRGQILRAFERADAARDAAERKRLLTFVLIGGGPTGVEMAGSLAELAKRSLVRDFRHVDLASACIILIEAMDQLLPGFPRDLAEFTRRRLERMGVQVHLNTRVEDINERGVVAAGATISAGTIIWSAGVSATPVAQWLKAEADRKGRVKVGPDLSAPGWPNVFVIGDAALVLDEKGQPLPGLAAVAKQQGRSVAQRILHNTQGQEPPKAFHYVNWGTLATIGRAAAVADFGWIRLQGWLAWIVWALVHIWYLIGFRNRLTVMINWLWEYAAFIPGARLITGKS